MYQWGGGGGGGGMGMGNIHQTYIQLRNLADLYGCPVSWLRTIKYLPLFQIWSWYKGFNSHVKFAFPQCFFKMIRKQHICRKEET